MRRVLLIFIIFLIFGNILFWVGMFLRIFGVGWGSVFTSVGLLVMYGYVLMGFGGVILGLDIIGGIYLVMKSRRKEL